MTSSARKIEIQQQELQKLAEEHAKKLAEMNKQKEDHEYKLVELRDEMCKIEEYDQ